mgnify:CR=1 FL=1
MELLTLRGVFYFGKDHLIRVVDEPLNRKSWKSLHWLHDFLLLILLLLLLFIIPTSILSILIVVMVERLLLHHSWLHLLNGILIILLLNKREANTVLSYLSNLTNCWKRHLNLVLGDYFVHLWQLSIVFRNVYDHFWPLRIKSRLLLFIDNLFLIIFLLATFISQSWCLYILCDFLDPFVRFIVECLFLFLLCMFFAVWDALIILFLNNPSSSSITVNINISICRSRI